jgi:UV DNA damage endonuclease
MNRAHADYIYEPIPTFGYEVDVELEAKAKELAVLKYKKDMFDRVALEAFSCV